MFDYEKYNKIRYMGYQFERYLYKWKNDKEMIYSVDSYDDTPVTIEYVDKDPNIFIIRRYHENGKLKMETCRKHRRAHGIQRKYYENGNLYITTKYKHGVRDGRVT